MIRYVRSPHLREEQRLGDDVVLEHGLLGTRLRLSASAQRLLAGFETPRTLEELVAPAVLSRALPVFDLLRRRHFVIDAGHTENIGDKGLQRVPRGLFGCPAPAAAGSPVDYTFLGVPFDLGNHGEPGARFGPDELRAAAAELHLNYAVDATSGCGLGFHDNETDRPLLVGARLADAGNVFVAPGEAPGHVFAKLCAAVREVLARGSFPVVLGGDHSLSHAVLEAYDEPLAVLHFDAHADLAPYQAGIEHHHGNVMSRVLQRPQVQALYQVGLRGITGASQLVTRERRPLALSPPRLREAGIEGLLARLPEEHAYYVSVDIDVLDPRCAPATSTPLPGGLERAELRELLAAVAARRRCVGFDLVELNPRRDQHRVTAFVALELLLTFLGARHARPTTHA